MNILVVGDATCAKKILGWEPQFTNVRDIIQHAWDWEKKFPWYVFVLDG